MGASSDKKSDDISNNSMERDSDTFMDEQQQQQQQHNQQQHQQQERLAGENTFSSGTPVYDEAADQDVAINTDEKILSQNNNASTDDGQQQQPQPQPHPHPHPQSGGELKMLVVIGDEQTIDGVQPLFGNAMEEILQQPQAKAIGNWHIYKESEFEPMANEFNNTIRGEIIRRIHHQLYWTAVYVKPNASYNYHQALAQGNTKYNASDNTVAVYYETGRDFLNMRSYVTPQLQKLQNMWFAQQSQILPKLAQNITIETMAQKQVISQPIHFTMVDRMPFNNNVLSAPLQVGFIYMIIVSFFQFNFFAEAHQKVAKSPVKRIHYVAYRYISSVCSFFFLSLIFGLITLAYQVKFSATYGKSGFLVYWSISFLTMCAVGLATEIMGMYIIPWYPPLLGFWLIFWVISNIAPTYTAMALTNNFFRYGYAMPVHNSYEATKTVFFDVYKGQLGRNFGILVAWVVVLSVIFPFSVMHFSKAMQKKAMAAAAQAQKEQAAKEKGEKTV
ncbi:hypothetical protein I9W82_000582 [Candida metapsilosis]|uniref:DUF3533 domain-containing protein n=1 Tax=Candida metapsilosis TaxID=273372 RepID=A0A8H8DEJ3_9ASCO|nr:hypothetical protein I9W82_000582 [Candida metapsilosis]